MGELGITLKQKQSIVVLGNPGKDPDFGAWYLTKIDASVKGDCIDQGLGP